jgi:hypothetical protein
MKRFASLLLTMIVFLTYTLCNNEKYTDTLVKDLLNARTKYGWTLDRSNNSCVVSSAATGVGFYAYAVAAEQKIITRNCAVTWIKEGFDAFVKTSPRWAGGWLYHFVDLEGKPTYSHEVSSIDTVIFYLGAQRAAEKLNDKLLLDHINNQAKKIDISLMMYGDQFKHGIGLPGKWDKYNEGILLYRYFDLPFYDNSPDYTLPLFVFYYPVAFYPYGQTSIWWKYHLRLACEFQVKTTGRLGYTACDTPWGYRVNSPYVISPLARLCCESALPELPITNIGITQSTSVDGSWVSTTKIYLDEGIALLLLTKEGQSNVGPEICQRMDRRSTKP